MEGRAIIVLAMLAVLLGAGGMVIASRPSVITPPELASTCPSGQVAQNETAAGMFQCVATKPGLNNSTSIIVNHDANGFEANCQTCIYARYTGVFDGANGFITVADSSTIKPTGDFTFAWNAKVNSLVSGERFFIKATGGGTGVDCRYNGGSGTIRCTIFALDIDRTADTNWHCYVLTRSGSTVTFYEDGASTSGTQGNDQSTTTSLFIGSSSSAPANLFNGAFSDFAYYNVAFSSTDQAQFCNQHTNIPTSSLNLWLSFNVKSSTAVVDMAGNGNTGTVSATGITWVWDNSSPKVFYSP